MNTKSIHLCFVFALLASTAFAQTSDEERGRAAGQSILKSVFISNFMNYVAWPQSSDDGTFTVGVVQDTMISSTLRQMHLKPHPKHGKVRVISMTNLTGADTMDILYTHVASGHSASDLFAVIGQQPVLLVTEGYDYNATMVNFIQVDNEMKFQLNTSNLSLQGLTATKLMESLADEVTEEDWESLVKDARETISEEKEKSHALEAQNQEMSRDMKVLSSRMRELRSEINTLEARIESGKAELQKLQAQSAAKRKEISEIQSSLERKELEFIQSQAALSEKSRELETKAAEVADAEETLRLKNQLLSDISAQYEEVKAQMTRVTILLENQKFVNLVLTLIGLLIAALAIIAYINYRKQRKQAEVISSQRDTLQLQHQELAIKNREILDSITYAKRIQQAILPPHRIVQNYLEQSFILYIPKDIVAGDFYWMHTLENRVIFTAADCTGHGVPGAMVSVVCSNALNRAVREFGLTSPSDILDKTIQIVTERFEKSEEDVKDGMDIALCTLHTDTSILEYSGAHNPLWLVTKPGHHEELVDSERKNINTHHIEGKEDHVLIEIKADKQPIGKVSEAKPYTPHQIQLEPGDTIYLFSDGYPDQFGGPKGKKFKYKTFKELLLEIYDQSMEEQRVTLNRVFEEWKGDLDQVDDVCVIGMRV